MVTIFSQEPTPPQSTLTKIHPLTVQFQIYLRLHLQTGTLLFQYNSFLAVAVFIVGISRGLPPGLVHYSWPLIEFSQVVCNDSSIYSQPEDAFIPDSESTTAEGNCCIVCTYSALFVYPCILTVLVRQPGISSILISVYWYNQNKQSLRSLRISTNTHYLTVCFLFTCRLEKATSWRLSNPRTCFE